MRSENYHRDIRVKGAKRAFISLLRSLFRRKLGNLTDEEFVIIGRATIFADLLFQQLLRVNADTPFLVHYTSRVLMADAISIERSPDSAATYRCFATSGGCYFMGANGIEIGRGVIFAPGVKVISANHDLSAPSSHTESPPVKLGAYSWLGANSIVLPGRTVGENAVVAAGAVVTEDIPPSEIWGGVPARRLGAVPPRKSTS